MTVLWPESDTDRARALLRDSVYRLRESLGAAAVVTIADELRLDTEQIQCDVCEFEEAVARGDLKEADRLYAGAFLDGFFLSGSAEFERWVDAERSRLAGMHAQVLESLAAQCYERGDLLGAVEVWRRRATADPYNGRVALRLMEALDAAGDRAGALHHGVTYAALLETEFGAAPDADVAGFLARLRGDPSDRHHSQIRRPTYPAPLPTGDELPPAASAGITPSLEPPQPTRRASAFATKLPHVAAALIVAAVAVVTGLRWYSGGPSSAALDGELVAVLPFRVTAPDTAHNYLREGMVDLVSAQLTGNGLPRAVDTRAVIGAYRRATRDAGGEDLTVKQSLSLARGLGASQVLLGEFVATSTGAALSARLLSVPSGRVLAEHSVNGTGNELVLITRLTGRLLAKSLGENATRLSGLSDSTEALRAYLSGMRAYRSGQVRKAFDEFGRALDIDSTFVPAALWRAYVSLGVFTIPPAEKRQADSVAWSFRQRVTRRDSLLLASLQSIGPNWPGPSTAVELIGALERAARANPDRPEVWHAWGRHLEAFGAQAGIPAHFDRAVSAADSAIALDSTFVPALGHRTYLAVLQSDTPAIRKFGNLHSRANVDGDRAALLEWMLARALGDRAQLPALLDRLAISPGGAWGNVETWAVFYGLSSLDEAERVARRRLAQSVAKPDLRSGVVQSLFRIAALRGHPRLALALADSLEEPDRPYFAVISLAIAGPGYDSAAWEAVRVLESNTDTVRAREVALNNLCYSQLWRVTQGDTTKSRVAISQMRRFVRTLDPASAQRAGRLELCPSLVEAAVAQRIPSRARSVALNEVTKLLLRGTLGERPHNFANVLVARWLEAEGDHDAALTIIRHMDPMAQVLAGPASLRMEGRLAAKLGDSAGAIRAYERFLAIRPSPDPGPLTDEVRAVRQELSGLTSRRATRLVRLR